MIKNAITALGSLLVSLTLSAQDPAISQDTPDKPRRVLELIHHEGNSRNSEGDIIRLNSGDLLYAYSKFTDGNGDDHDACVIASRISRDGGMTWSQEDRILARNTIETDGNVMSVSLLRLSDQEIGLFYGRKLGGKTSPMVIEWLMRTTLDDGKTWSQEVEITDGFTPSYKVVNNARIQRLSSGRVLIPVSEHGFRDNNPNSFINRGILYCLYSDDNCRTWQQSQTLEIKDYTGEYVISQEPGVLELEDGRVLMYIRSYSGCQWYAYSSDGGLTWEKPRPSALRSPVSPATLFRLQSGEILGVWNNHERQEELTWDYFNGYGIRTPLTLGLSGDEGKTWHHVRNLEDGFDAQDVYHYWYCYISVMELEDGLLLSYCAENNLKDSRIVYVPKNWLMETEGQ